MDIRIQDLSMTYPNGKQALSNLNLELKAPSMIGLLGPNGAGKSTLMKLLTAALVPSNGSILVDGQPLLKQEHLLKSHLGYLPQTFGLYEELTVYQFLDYMAALKGLSNTKTILTRVIQEVNLTEKSNARIRTLSGGQRQRVGIAQAFLGDPKLLIFDEPTVGLDPEERIHFRNLFSQAAQERLVLLSTHIIEDVQSVCDQLIVIHHGSILFTGAPSDLIRLAAGHVGTFFEQDTSHEQGLHITSRVNTAFGVRCRGGMGNTSLLRSRRRTHLRRRLPLSDLQGGTAMRIFSLFWLEFRRLLHSPLTWLIMGLTVLSPVMGLFLYQPTEATTLGTYLANPSLAAGIFSSLLFAFLTVWEWNRVKRGQMEALLYSIVSPLTVSCIRLLSLIGTAGLAWSITVVVWMPFTMMASGSVFDSLTYFLCYFLFMGMAIPIAILLSSCAYQFTRRLDLSIVILAALAGLSLTIWKDNWQLCWLNPCVWAISDDFTNFRIFRSVAYMRFTWITGAAAVWLLSYLCIRQYGKGPLGSMKYSIRRFWRPMITVCLFAFCGFLYKFQPFLDHSNPDLSATTFFEIPYLEGVFCEKRFSDVHPNLSNGTVSGTASFQIENTTGTEQEVAFALNPGYKVNSVQANGQPVPFQIDDYQESNMALLNVTIPALESIDLCFDYHGFPQDWNLMETMQGKPEISSKYLCLENQALAPAIMNAGTADGTLSSITDITLPDTMTVIPFGLAEAKKEAEHDNGTITWRIEDTENRGILYAGDYVRQDIEAVGTTIQFYYGRKHQPIMEEANAAEAIQTVMEYCSSHYGMPQFFSFDSLKLIQGRISNGGYARSGVSLVDEQDFTAQNLHDSDKGAIPGEVMIHEMVHQWWGLGAMFDVSQPDSAWSAEGLTVYTTYRIIKDLYGDAYAKEHYIDQWQTAVDDYYNNFYIRNPQYLEALPEEKRLDISNQLSTMRYYNEMPLKILKAEELVGGEEAMDQILYQLFNREVDPMYPYLTEQEFLDACGLTEEDLNLD